MALLLALACGLLASANAGVMMQGMMGGYQQQPMQMVPMGNGGCNQGSDGHMPAGCEIPDMSFDNMEQYLQQQMQQQQYETQAMADRIKAQFEGLVKNVTAKKQRFAMSLVTEYISFCECGRSSNELYNAVFLQQAQALNLTDGVAEFDYNRPAYEAKNEEEARGLILAGVIRSICESALAFLQFADQVNQRIPAFQGKK